MALAATWDGSAKSGLDLLPYLDPLSGVSVRSPDWFVDEGGMQAEGGMFSPASVQLLGAPVYGSGVHAASADISQILDPAGSGLFEGIKRPDWLSFWHVDTIELPGSGDGQVGVYNKWFDKAGATTAYNRWQDDLEAAAGLDPSRYYFVDYGALNPTSEQGSRDRLRTLYQLQPDYSAVPVYAENVHNTSNWVSARPLVSMIAATFAAAFGAQAIGAAVSAGAGGAAGGSGALVDGAFLGEGVASGVAAWDAAATTAGLTLASSPAASFVDGAFLGENVASGVSAWDAAATNAGLTLTTSAAPLLDYPSLPTTSTPTSPTSSTPTSPTSSTPTPTSSTLPPATLPTLGQIGKGIVDVAKGLAPVLGIVGTVDQLTGGQLLGGTTDSGVGTVAPGQSPQTPTASAASWIQAHPLLTLTAAGLVVYLIARK